LEGGGGQISRAISDGVESQHQVKHQDTKFDDKEKNNNKKNFESGGRKSS